MPSASANEYVTAIRRSGKSIYDAIEIGDSGLWIPTPILEHLLNEAMQGLSLSGLALRTRSRIIKEQVCTALGYPIPSTFKRTQPRFPGQRFDTYAQKSTNLQVWNEELEPTRRYVIFQISESDTILKVKVVQGDVLAALDTTGTLTQKFQARLVPGSRNMELVGEGDTESLKRIVRRNINLQAETSPACAPQADTLLAIEEILEKLHPLIGVSFPDIGHDQERNRGAVLHELVCRKLGYSNYQDDGRFPDIRHQLLEVKLQTSPTIDLGLVCPNSSEPLADIPPIGGHEICCLDVRYALFYAKKQGNSISLTHVFLTSGESFFSRFPQFQGNVLNRKRQIRLPANFFEL